MGMFSRSINALNEENQCRVMVCGLGSRECLAGGITSGARPRKVGVGRPVLAKGAESETGLLLCWNRFGRTTLEDEDEDEGDEAIGRLQQLQLSKRLLCVGRRAETLGTRWQPGVWVRRFLRWQLAQQRAAG